MIGRKISHYRINEKIGTGGMGEVYRATDSKLGRDVAIKVLPDAFSQDADRMARFAREAQILAALNHPNISSIYGLEENALVMELVEGPTLADRIATGRMPVKEVLPVARQIAEAVEYAHERGIIHRDLKPANVKLTAEGQVKVLDFGLAKARESAAGSALESPTLTISPTQTGVILGTAAYMSPEQASGKPVDKRADIWSFGVILWELLTGRRLFNGETVSHTLAEVLRGPIGFDQLPRETSPALRGLLRRCLDRNVKNRLRDIGEARIAIEATLACATPILEGASEPGGARRLWLAWSVAAMATVLAAGLAPFTFLYFRTKVPAPAAPVRFQVPSHGQVPSYGLLSADGRKLADIAGGRLWVHSLETGESRDIAVLASGVPFWSPDSRFIGYLSEGKIKKVEATGGPPQTVADFAGTWGAGAWNPDDLIVFADQRIGLFRVPASGGVPIQIAAVDPARQETIHFGPSFLQDGQHFVYTRASIDKAKSAVFIGTVDAKPEQQSTKSLVNSNWQAVYTSSADPSTGYLLFMSEGTLMAQPFDNRRLELKGQALPVAEQVADNSGGGTGGWAFFSASANDVLSFRRRGSAQPLTWCDREGKVLGTAESLGSDGYLALSPDGMRLAVTKGVAPVAVQIWLSDLSRSGSGTRFTFGSASNTSPVWVPDGSRIIFSSNRDGPYNLYQKPANGAKDEELLWKSSEDKYATSCSPDGRFLLYTAVHPRTKNDIWVLPLEGDRKPVPFLVTTFGERQARFSPDGNWVAYSSDESGQDEVYVRSFSMNSSGRALESGGKWPISNGFGVDPHWRGDGRELYYRNLDGRLMAVETAANPAFRAGSPQSLGVLTFVFGNSVNFAFGSLWDSSAEGRRFLTRGNASGPLSYTVVLNWQASLKK